MQAEQDIRAVFDQYVSSWNEHDMQRWGKLFTDDTDFIAWSGGWYKSNQENVENHQRAHTMLKEQHQNMTYQLELVEINFLTPDIALVYALWQWNEFKTVTGLQNRTGTLSMVLLKEGDAWKIRSTQNTRTDKFPD